jgi:hypothetical protein
MRLGGGPLTAGFDIEVLASDQTHPASIDVADAIPGNSR